MTRKQFRIEGMHCVGCAMTIDSALEDLHGVVSASTSYAKQIANVVYDDSKVTEEQVVEAVREAGYRATLTI
jgi:P-type Cu+ transporter